MVDVIRVVCERTKAMGRDFARLPENLMKLMDLEEGDYLKLINESSGGKIKECVIRVYSLSPGQNLRPIITLPTHRIEELGAKYGEVIKISKIKIERLKLKAHWSLKKDVGKNVCRIHPKYLEHLGISEGDLVELRNPKKDPEGAGRLIIKVLKSGADEEVNHIRLDAGSRIY